MADITEVYLNYGTPSWAVPTGGASSTSSARAGRNSGLSSSTAAEIPTAEGFSDGTFYYRNQVLGNSGESANWLVGSLFAVAAVSRVASIALLADDVTLAGLADDPFLIVTEGISFAARRAATYLATKMAQRAVLQAAIRTAAGSTLLAATACTFDIHGIDDPNDAGTSQSMINISQSPVNPIPIPYGEDTVPVDLTLTAVEIASAPDIEVAVLGPYSYTSAWVSLDADSGSRVFRIPVSVADALATPVTSASIYSRLKGDPGSIESSIWSMQFAPPGSPNWDLELVLPEDDVFVSQTEVLQLSVQATTPEAVELWSDFHPVIVVAGQTVAVYTEDSEAFPLRRTEGSGDDEIVFEFEHTFRYPGVTTVNAQATVGGLVFRIAGQITVIESDVTPRDGGPEPDAPRPGADASDAAGFGARMDASRPDAPMDGSMPDEGAPDAGSPDSEIPDAGTDLGDSDRMDAGSDGPLPDEGVPDAGEDGTVVFDTTPPITSHNAPTGWMRGPVTVTLTATDDNSGVEGTEYCVDQEDVCAPGTLGTNVTVEPEGTNFVRFRSVDVDGNVEQIQSVPVRIDNTPPVTVASVPGEGWQMPPVTVTLIPTDSLSGISETLYCVDQDSSCEPNITGTAVTISDEGEHFVRFQSIDNAGNEEAVRTAVVATADTLRNAHCELGYTICTDMNEDDTDNWTRVDGRANDPPFNNGWRSENITFRDGVMITELNDTGCPIECSDRPYASGEYRSVAESYGYGFLEARIKAARHNGIVGGSLFFYQGTPHHEIDIEFLGRDTTFMQTNYITDGEGGHETEIRLGFDASEDFHTYGIEWRGSGISWYVDGAWVHSEDGERGPLPSLPGCIKMNMWPGVGVDEWLGPFSYDGPIQSEVDWVRYSTF